MSSSCIHITERAYALPRWAFYISHHTCSHLSVLTQCSSTTAQSQVRSVFVTQQRCECALKMSMCAVMCVHVYLCVCAHLTLLSVVSLQRKEHNNWSKLDLAGCKGAVLWTWSYWNSMEYSMHLCLCYAQLSLLFWVLKIHNAKLELFIWCLHALWMLFFSCSIEKWLHHM